VIYLKNSVGIEIRQQDLVISCLRSNFSGSVFTGFKRVAGYRTRERTQVREEVAHYFKTQRLSRDNIVLGVPRSDVIIRYLDLPREVEDNLKQVVLYQIQSFEPSESEKYYHDYSQLKTGETDRRLRVLLFLIKKSTLDAHLEVMGDLGIRPLKVTVGSAALVNVFLGALNGSAGNTFVLADLKETGIETLLVRNGSLVHSREAARVEGEAWGALLRQELELAVSRARLDPEETIESVVLAGEAAEAAQREVREEMPECRLIGDFVRFEMPLENRARLQEAAISLGLAFTGMVRRPPLGLNLLPHELRVHQARWAYVPTIVLGLIIAGVLVGLGTHRVMQERIVIRELDRQIQALQPQVDRVVRVRAQAETLGKKITYVEGLLRRRDMNLELLQELTNILPSDTFLNIYRNQDCTITLSGASSSADALIPALERSPLIMNVVQKGATYKDPQSGKDRFNLDAKCER
jgi:Tfp pilus assembly PilM family ATPase/Tfp pilus assembly protein PilN